MGVVHTLLLEECCALWDKGHHVDSRPGLQPQCQYSDSGHFETNKVWSGLISGGEVPHKYIRLFSLEIVHRETSVIYFWLKF